MFESHGTHARPMPMPMACIRTAHSARQSARTSREKWSGGSRVTHISFIRLVSHCDGQLDMFCDSFVCEKHMHLATIGNGQSDWPLQYALCALRLVNSRNESKQADRHESGYP